MTDQPTPAAIDRMTRAGAPVLALLFALLLAGAVAIFALIPKADAANLAMGFLALLAGAGVFAVFAFAAGLLKFSGAPTRDDITKPICDGLLQGVVVTGSDGEIIYANAAYMHLPGARGPTGLRTVEQLFSSASDASQAVYRLSQAARAGNAAVEDVRLCPPLSGAGRRAEPGADPAAWYKISVAPLAIAAGGRAAGLWTIGEKSLERDSGQGAGQERRPAIDLLDEAPAGFFSCDSRGVVSGMNATLAAWLNVELTEAGAGAFTLSDILAGDGAARVAAMAGAPDSVFTGQFDVDLKCRGGQSLPVRLLHKAAFDAYGAALPSRTLVLDRARAAGPAENPRSTEDRFARAFTETPMAIAIVESGGRIARSNAAFARLMPAALNGSGHDAGRSIYAGVLPRDHQALEAALTATAQSRADVPPLDVALAGEGDRSARLFLSAPDDRDATGATIYAIDTTEQRVLQSNYAQSQKMQAIGQLAGGVAHDFNNVLTAIIGYSDLLLANHRPTDPSFRDIMQIKQNANRAAGLVRQLLAFSRRQTLRPQILQLGDVLADLQMLMRRLVGEKINLELRHGRELWPVKADLNQFEQVIVNLIVNARDAMPDGGQILLRTRNVMPDDCAGFDEKSLLAAKYVAIEVEDFGHGVAADVKDKIFEPFFTTKDIGKGTGLGLAMVYGIVKQTGGYVFCHSAPGKGAIFTVLLPRHIADAEDARPAREPEKIAADLTGHGVILLVEDEEAVRAFAARALASRGYSVLQAASGLEALDIVDQKQGKIDLVVSDVVMPEMDGPTMFCELRKRGVTAKVIFVSGYAEDAFEKNLPGGADFAFLPKPFSLKQLIEAVKAAAG